MIKRHQAEYKRLQDRINAMYVDKLDGEPRLTESESPLRLIYLFRKLSQKAFYMLQRAMRVLQIEK